MKKHFIPKPFLFLLFLGLLLASGCAGANSSQATQLPPGFASAMVPDMPLDGYFFAQQVQPTILPGLLIGLPSDVTIQSVGIWLVPSESTEIVGAVVTMPTALEAEALFPRIPQRDGLWKQLASNNIFAVWGAGNGAEELKTAIQARKFVPITTAVPDAWDLIQRLPSQAAAKPSGVGFVRLEDNLIAFFQKNPRGAVDPGAASALKMTGIKMAATAVYSNRALKVTDFLSPANLREAGLGGILIAKSSYPGFVISAALGSAASRLSLEKSSLDGKTTYYRAVDGPAGEKLHLLVNNSGSYFFASAAADLSRAQQLQRWVLGLE